MEVTSRSVRTCFWSPHIVWILAAILAKSAGNAFGKMAGLTSRGEAVYSVLWNPYDLAMLVLFGLQAVFWVPVIWA
jgi:hypothetical protein